MKKTTIVSTTISLVIIWGACTLSLLDIIDIKIQIIITVFAVICHAIFIIRK